MSQEQIKYHVKCHMDWNKYLPVCCESGYIGFTPISNKEIILTPEEYEKLENTKVLKHTPNMPWEGDFAVKRDVFTTSDFTCRYDYILEMYDHEEIPTEIWKRLKDEEEKE